MPSSPLKEQQQQPPLGVSALSYEEGDIDEDEEGHVLEAMLAKAKLLANEIKETSAAASRAGSSSSSFVRGCSDSVEMNSKDNNDVTECSSVGYGMLLPSSSTETNDSVEQGMHMEAKNAIEFLAQTKVSLDRSINIVKGPLNQGVRSAVNVALSETLNVALAAPNKAPLAAITAVVAPSTDDELRNPVLQVGESSPSVPVEPMVDEPSMKAVTPTAQASFETTRENEATGNVAAAVLRLKEAIPSSSFNVAVVDASPTPVSLIALEPLKSDKPKRLQNEALQRTVDPVHSSSSKAQREASEFDVDAVVKTAKEMELQLREVLSMSFSNEGGQDVTPTEIPSIAVGPPKDEQTTRLVIQVDSSPSEPEEQKTDLPLAVKRAAMDPARIKTRRERAPFDADATANAVQLMELQLNTAFNLDSRFSNMTSAADSLLSSSVAIATPEAENFSRILRQVESSSQHEEHKTDMSPAKQPTALIQTPPHSNSKTIHWEGTTFALEKDDDYVPIADYSSKSRPARPSGTGGRQGDESAVRWERVTSAFEGDADYVPLSDYSSPTNSRRRDIHDPELLELTYSGHRAAIRRRRKKRRRRLVMLTVISVFAVGVLLLRRFNAVVEVEQDGPVEIEQDDVEQDKIEQYESMESVVEVDDQAPVFAYEYLCGEGEAVPEVVEEVIYSDSTAVVVADTNGSLQAEFNICQLPFASIISPMCRSEGKKGVLIPNPQERRRMVEELVQNMMQ